MYYRYATLIPYIFTNREDCIITTVPHLYSPLFDQLWKAYGLEAKRLPFSFVFLSFSTALRSGYLFHGHPVEEVKPQ